MLFVGVSFSDYCIWRLVSSLALQNISKLSAVVQCRAGQRKKKQLVQSHIFYHWCELLRATLFFSLRGFSFVNWCTFAVFSLLQLLSSCAFEPKKQGPIVVSTCNQTHLSLIDHHHLLMACMSLRWWLVVYKVHGKGGGASLECWNLLFKMETSVQGSPPPLQLGNNTEDGRGDSRNSVKTQEWENCPGHISVIGPTLAVTLTIE